MTPATSTPGSDAAAETGTMTGAPTLPAQAALFLDVDGTLVHLADHPDAVHVDDVLRVLLARVEARVSGALALISGRAIDDVDALFSPARFAIAGQHGSERRCVDGTMHRHASFAARLRKPAEQLRQFARDHPGLLLEEKGASLALHYRLAPTLEALAESEARRVLADLGDDFHLQAGKFVFEVKPGGRDKGTAIAEYMAEQPFSGRVPVFVGDDLTDELGFEFVNSQGGVTIKVGAGPTCARWRLADADAVRRWLTACVLTHGGQ